MRVAIPVAGGRLAAHFGHCETFALLDIELHRRHLSGRQDVAAPPHEPGLLPHWLAEQGVEMIIAGGMGQRAQDLFLQNGITVYVGAPAVEPELLVQKFMTGSLSLGTNCCDH
ncbi:NifB/NifX family molybdenum-iron cluster-binding protein [Trichlorobacter lovleyi]|uniref:Dinitrogenase iron-molybdenum cofactor biosynthesis protein n=1 Tax=Trichlorobacter lovleyi (strain ATCC BAA-1151 / DSM 17278 / SZ) TaxID=398767 RepID=B3EAH1_TRIL1|nr:NifB/NifX family molybdenum-iron cluster-binding protein [Trichlorobacter lovleyi]ACD95409.1 Dinitrogenase iron-molybdenum cofactor biosynthesis protein [Trichlorobacter lovleyi SZ]